MKSATPVQEQYTATDFAYASSLAGFYSVVTGRREHVPAGRMAVIHNQTTLDGVLVVDGRVISI